jgi:hypothetical protein
MTSTDRKPCARARLLAPIVDQGRGELPPPYHHRHDSPRGKRLLKGGQLLIQRKHPVKLSITHKLPEPRAELITQFLNR